MKLSSKQTAAVLTAFRIGVISGAIILGVGIRLATAGLAPLTGYPANLSASGLLESMWIGGLVGAPVGLMAFVLAKYLKKAVFLRISLLTLLQILLSILPVLIFGKFHWAKLEAFHRTYLLVATFFLLNSLLTDFLLRKRLWPVISNN